MGVVALWLVKVVLCPTVARTSAPRVASRGKTSLELLEGSLGRAEVVKWITTWVYACDQPRRINPPGSFSLLHKALLKCLCLKGWGAQGNLPFVLDIVARRTLSEGSLAATLVLDLGGDNG